VTYRAVEARARVRVRRAIRCMMAAVSLDLGFVWSGGEKLRSVGTLNGTVSVVFAEWSCGVSLAT
jgi:hypothetical protein